VGQIAGAFVGGAAAEVWALDGILAATLILLAVALVPLARLRRFEHRFEPSPASGPDVEALDEMGASEDLGRAGAAVSARDGRVG
jgi:hypothetical protein